MKFSSLFIKFDLLKTHPHFRAVFIARTISLLGLGILSVALPWQIYQLTQSSFWVGAVLACEAIGLFAGLMVGGVRADQANRRTLILWARGLCALGFLGLAINAQLASPSLGWIIFLSLWDGFFGAIGVTALLAAMPQIVGRAHLLQARAISMASMRLVTIASPAIGGLMISVSDLSWVYGFITLTTFITLLPLLKLPPLLPQDIIIQSPFKALAEGFRFIVGNRVLLSAFGIGLLVTLSSGVRVLFPAFVDEYFKGDAAILGLIFSAVPVGATLGAFMSGWVEHLARPGLWLLRLSALAIACIVLFSFTTWLPLLLLLLAGYGYLTTLAGLLQYTLIQVHTPDPLLGRVNALCTAQDASGDSISAIAYGSFAGVFGSAAGLFAVGLSLLGLSLGMLAGCRSLRLSSLSTPTSEPNDALESRLAN